MEIVILKMLLVGLYFWYPCRLVGLKLIPSPDRDIAMEFLYAVTGLLLHVVLFALFLLCGGAQYLPNCGSH